MTNIVTTLRPPYYAVIFTSQRSDGDNDYAATAKRMLELAAKQPGFLGVESARSAEGMGITVSYWQTLEDIKQWKQVGEHVTAQEKGRSDWYQQYRVRICKVEHEYGFKFEN